MARRSKPDNKPPATPTAAPATTGRQTPNERVIEDGEGEQGDERTVRQRTARGKERENFRHGGIPPGADPRE